MTKKPSEKKTDKALPLWTRVCFVCGAKGSKHLASGLSLCTVCARCASPDAMADAIAGRNVLRIRGDIALARARDAERQRDWWRGKLQSELRNSARTWQRYMATAHGPRPTSAAVVEEVISWLSGLDEGPAVHAPNHDIDTENIDQ
jgi:hypothetical protein